MAMRDATSPATISFPRVDTSIRPADSWTDRSLYERCISRGVPGSISAVLYGNGVRFVQSPSEIVMTYEMIHDSRVIYTDGRPMPPAEDMWPTVWGTSIGHWEGDTLVVETVQVQMPYEYFHGAPSLSEEAVYRERIRMDGERLVLDFTIEDPVTLSEPWEVTIVQVREEAFDRMIQMDFSNDRTGVENGINTIEPPAE